MATKLVTISIDQRGEDRIQGTVVDIGAYESSVVFANFAPVLDVMPDPVLTAIDEDPIINDGSTAFSSATDTADIAIIVVDDAPEVQNAIADVTVDENASDTIIDLSNVFTDVDNDDAAITKAVITNTNPSLVTANIAGDTFTLDYQVDQFGTADITVEATSNGKTVTDTLTVTVNQNFNINAQSANWEIQDAAYFDGDGKADLLWHDPVTGQNALWMMDGLTRIDSGNISGAVSRWQVGSTSDFDGDGDRDIFWRDPIAGDNAMWLMDGVNSPSGILT